MVATIESEGLTVNEKAAHESAARGEAVVVQRGGGRFVTVACDSEVYHSVADRWPEAVDVALLARYAKAFANGALVLAQQSSARHPPASSLAGPTDDGTYPDSPTILAFAKAT